MRGPDGRRSRRGPINGWWSPSLSRHERVCAQPAQSHSGGHEASHRVRSVAHGLERLSDGYLGDDVRDDAVLGFQRDVHLGVGADGDLDEAIKILRKRRFQLAFVDVRMEPVSGLEVLDDIHKTSPETPVVLVTAYASVETAVAALRKGAKDLFIR